MLLLTLLTVVLGTRVLNPPVHILREHIETLNLSREVYETMNLNYYAYPGVFALQLHRRINGSITDEQVNLNEFELVEAEVEEPENGCFSSPRSIEVKYQLQLQLGAEFSQDVYFTDVATAEDSSRIYIIRNDLELFEIDIDYGLKRIDLNPVQKSFRDLVEPIEFLVPYLVDDIGTQRVYVITANGGVSFDTSKSISDTEFRVEPFQIRKNIHSVHYNPLKQVIIVAAGIEGIDIYNVAEGKAVHMNQVTNPGGDIIDADSNEQQTVLIVLDKEIGLQFYDVKDINSMTLIMTIPITNARSFDHYGNTYYVVARTNTRQDYAVEIFVNLEKREYYFNNYLIDDTTINDVNVFEHYAILIGEDAHKIIYHSIYNGFLDTDFVTHTYFEEEDLLRLKEYDFSMKNESQFRFLVGIAKHQFKYLEIEFIVPSIRCELYSPRSEQYLVLLNSTQCNSKKQLNDSSPYTLCSILNLFNYNAVQQLGNYGQYTKMTLIAYVLFVVLVWVIVIGYALCRRWGVVIRFLSWKKQRMDQQQAYNESFEVKEQEMVDNQQSSR